jgi:hypothetical protein
MQMEPESTYDKSSVVNTAFLKSATFWLRLVLIALLFAGWVSILQLTVLDFDTNSVINIWGTEFKIRCTYLYFYKRTVIFFLNDVKLIYLCIAITAWILSILYVFLNIFNVQKYLGKFSLRTLVRYF